MPCYAWQICLHSVYQVHVFSICEADKAENCIKLIFCTVFYILCFDIISTYTVILEEFCGGFTFI
jgi:hypothetical protein